MENDLNIDLSLIGSVLERAAVEISAPPVTDTVEVSGQIRALGDFIKRAAGAGRMYDLLALKMAGTGAQRELAELAREERDTEKALQTEHLLLTGDTVALTAAYPSAPYLIRALRDAYDAEQKNAQAYEAAAGGLDACPLRGLYGKLAARERSHAAVLRGIIGRTIY